MTSHTTTPSAPLSAAPPTSADCHAAAALARACYELEDGVRLARLAQNGDFWFAVEPRVMHLLEHMTEMEKLFCDLFGRVRWLQALRKS